MNRKIWTSDDKLDLAKSLEYLQSKNQELEAKLYEMNLRIEKLEAQQPTPLAQLRKRVSEPKQ